ncbi:AI-2E family transporter [Clostridium prolinivorans]|uniref:AI-2E family transporter n=1 Tax=Clostridium prolinivorans TaxID=2769420 RepID=UPI000FD8FDFF|nr:AI-2E family transporter [Clostridium prolinivorans]
MKKIYKSVIIYIIFFVILYISLKSSVIKEVYYLVFVSFIISYCLRPLTQILTHRGISKKISVVLILFMFVIFILGTFIILIPSIFKESLNMSFAFSQIKIFIGNFYEKLKLLSNNKTIYAILDTIYSNINKIVIDIFNKMFNGTLKIGENILSLAVVPIVVYYFLVDSEIISNKFFILFPPKWRNIVKKTFEDIDKILGRYIISQFILCGIIGILTFIVLLILKVDFPIILSLLNAFFNIIPYFGPLFGAVPAVLIAFLSSTKSAVWTAIALYAIQQLEGDIISPKITGDSVSMHPLAVIILIIVGGKIGGMIGMVLAVPLGVIIKILYEDLNYYLF